MNSNEGVKRTSALMEALRTKEKGKGEIKNLPVFRTSRVLGFAFYYFTQ